jgi:hypothetical protein
MPGRWSVWCAGLAVTALAATPCESDEEKPPTPYQAFNDEYADAFCAALEPCCALVPFSVGECRTWLGFAFAAQGNARADKFVFHQDRADQCLRELRSEGVCTGDVPLSCNQVTEGEVSGGFPCEGNAECVASERSPGICRQEDDGNGFCLFPGRAGALGEACASNCDDAYSCSSQVAGEDVYCYRDTGLECVGGTCQALDAIGAACSFGSCIDSATCREGVCIARAGVGGKCSSSDECTDENYCASGACTPRKLAGSACDPSADECRGSCFEGQCSDLVLETLCAFGAPF